MKKLLLALLMIGGMLTPSMASDYYRYRYPDLYPPPPPAYYYAPPPPPPPVYAPPPPAYYYPPPPPPAPYSDPGLAMFNFWAGIITRGVNCMPRYVGVDRWGRPVYQPVC